MDKFYNRKGYKYISNLREMCINYRVKINMTIYIKETVQFLIVDNILLNEFYGQTHIFKRTLILTYVDTYFFRTARLIVPC